MAEEKKLILPYDDFNPNSEEGTKELEDKKQELEKTVRDALEDGLKVADEINGDEHTEAFPEEPKMPKNEKLVLKEPETNLNEDLGNDLNNFGRDVYDAIKGVLDKYPGADIDDVKFALRYFGGRINFSNNTWDESMEESKKLHVEHKLRGRN